MLVREFSKFVCNVQLFWEGHKKICGLLRKAGLYIASLQFLHFVLPCFQTNCVGSAFKNLTSKFWWFIKVLYFGCMFNCRQGFSSELFCHRLVFELVLWSDFSVDIYVFTMIHDFIRCLKYYWSWKSSYCLFYFNGSWRDIEFQNPKFVTSCPCSQITMCLKSLGKILRL